MSKRRKPAGGVAKPRGKTMPKGKAPAADGKRGSPGSISAGEPRSDQVPIRLPSGEQAWVSADAFNLISEKEFRDSERLRRLRGQRNLAAAAAGIALVVLAAGAVALLTRPAAPGAGETGESAAAAPDSPTLVEPEAAGTAPTDAAPAALSRDTSSGAPEPPEPPPATPEVLEIKATVRAWARAWSARDAEAVLAFYSPSFLVPDGMRRATWEQLRRERIENPELLSVTVEDLAAERTGEVSATARFLQVYDTPGYRVWVMKTLELASESGRWRIVDELASLAEAGTGAFKGEVELVQPVPE